MTDYDTPPGEWFEVETKYDFQDKMWRDGASGYAVVVETREEPWHDETEAPDYQVFLLPQDHDDNPDPVTTIVAGTKERDHAIYEAHDFMSQSEV